MTDGQGLWIGPDHQSETYRLTSPLQAGAEADMWHGYALGDESRPVAIKIYRDRLVDPSLTALRHPNIVEILDSFEGSGYHRPGEIGTGRFTFVIMGYIEGIDLRQWMIEHPRATVADRLRLVRGLAAALDYLHSGATSGGALVHGDVKPENVIVRPDGNPVLIDLGQIRRVGETAAMGTPAYAAPEIDGAAAASPVTDAFSFLIVVAEVVLGIRVPLNHDGGVHNAALLRDLRRAAPAARLTQLAQALRVALAGPPAGRPVRLRTWLDRTVSDRASQTQTHIPELPAAGANPRRRRSLILLVAVFLAAVITAAVAAAVLIRSPHTVTDADKRTALSNAAHAFTTPPGNSSPTAVQAARRNRRRQTASAARPVVPTHPTVMTSSVFTSPKAASPLRQSVTPSHRLPSASRVSSASPVARPSSATSEPSATPSSSSSASPVGQSYKETLGPPNSGSTWTDYNTGGGDRGQTIAIYQTVAIRCAVQGLRVQDGNTWWYLIAASPWNDEYYISADAFYNNGSTSGSLHGTPFVDPAVPPC